MSGPRRSPRKSPEDRKSDSAGSLETGGWVWQSLSRIIASGCSRCSGIPIHNRGRHPREKGCKKELALSNADLQQFSYVINCDLLKPLFEGQPYSECFKCERPIRRHRQSRPFSTVVPESDPERDLMLKCAAFRFMVIV